MIINIKINIFYSIKLSFLF